MSVFKEAFGFLQKIGKSLMLPVSVLPVAGILLGVGKSNFAILGPTLSKIMAASGGAIFGNLPLIFAIGVALGLTGNDGVSALAAVVGYVVLLASMGVMAGVWASVGLPWLPDQSLKTEPIMGIESLDTGVFGGILIGAVAAFMFNRYYRIKLPPYLGFFAGKRFVPIVTAFAAVGMGVGLSLLWPPVQVVIQKAADYAAYGQPARAVFLYGFVERLLIPFGLHHIWNVPFFFQMGSFTDAAGKLVHGDMNRFFALDPTAGILGGGFLFKMWGLPAAALAIWRCAKPERRVEIGSIMVSAALTSFLTGITEPIEFSFIFVAPLLYGIHALLAGTAFVLMQVLDSHMGFTFSQGFIDYLLYFKLDTRPWLVLVLGPLYALIYYGAFSVLITKLNLKTPGREDADTVSVGIDTGGAESLAARVLAALGGASNLTSLDACITRLRVGLRNMDAADPARLKALGAAGVVVVGKGMQAIFGTQSENLKTDIEILIKSLGDTVASPSVGPPAGGAPTARLSESLPPREKPRPKPSAAALERGRAVLQCIGGAENLKEVQAVGLTRVRLVVHDRRKVNDATLSQLGPAFMEPTPGTLHLLVGSRCEEDAAAIEALK